MQKEEIIAAKGKKLNESSGQQINLTMNKENKN